jgi:hypothetical protein
MHQRLQPEGWKSIHNPPSPTVAFRKPARSDIVRRYQISVQGDFARVVVLPHIDRRVLDMFLDELFTSIPIA